MFPIILLALLLRAEKAAASQHSGGQASEGRPGEDPRPALDTALGATVSAGTGSSSPDRVGGFEQPYGAQAFRGAVQKDCTPELLAHMTHSC